MNTKGKGPVEASAKVSEANTIMAQMEAMRDDAQGISEESDTPEGDGESLSLSSIKRLSGTMSLSEIRRIIGLAFDTVSTHLESGDYVKATETAQKFIFNGGRVALEFVQRAQVRCALPFGLLPVGSVIEFTRDGKRVRFVKVDMHREKTEKEARNENVFRQAVMVAIDEGEAIAAYRKEGIEYTSDAIRKMSGGEENETLHLNENGEPRRYNPVPMA